MVAWTVRHVNGNAILVPDKPLYCPICANILVLHDFYCYHGRFYHCDVHMKCLGCSLYLIFGVRVTYSEYRELTRSRYHGRTLLHELLELKDVLYLSDNDIQVVRERLKRWGYW